MLRFPINSQIQIPTSEIQLNDKWTVVFNINLTEEFKRSDFYLKHNGINPSEEILISGTLTFPGANPKTETIIFSFDWNMACDFMYLGLMDKIDSSSKTIRLLGEITIVSKCKRCVCALTSEETGKSIQPKSMVKLSNDFEQLLHPQEPSFSDVTLTCGDVSIPAHKMILSARSPFFAAMFKHPMKENLENKVCITDLDEPVFQAMMKYIYSGKTSNLTVELASDLLMAADKYQLQDLKEACCNFLKSNITSENLVSIIVLGVRLMKDSNYQV